jgi:hypothetical protein
MQGVGLLGETEREYFDKIAVAIRENIRQEQWSLASEVNECIQTQKSLNVS